MPIKRKIYAIGIKKNGSTSVPSEATSEPIILKAIKQQKLKPNGKR
ncbi:hypothetical protein JOC62_000331 [Clostridium sardiniense]|nr:hypothetical protein [Clostridium sardiniense]